MINKLTKKQIEEINNKCPYNQGIFIEPFGIPNNIKEPVIYTKWESAGRPGSCWDDENTINEDYECERPNDAYDVLDIALKIIYPSITFLEYKKIIGAMDSNEKTDYGYYGDYTTDTIEWITLTDLYKILENQ